MSVALDRLEALERLEQAVARGLEHATDTDEEAEAALQLDALRSALEVFRHALSLDAPSIGERGAARASCIRATRAPARALEPLYRDHGCARCGHGVLCGCDR